MIPGVRWHTERPYGAAPESNRASRGLHDLTGFEDRLGHRARPLRRKASAKRGREGAAGEMPPTVDTKRARRATAGRVTTALR